MRKLMLSAAVSAALLIAAPFAATAASAQTGDSVPQPLSSESSSPSPTVTQYPPDNPTQPSLSGSSAVPTCAQDVPWISYEVLLTDPNNLSTSNVATLVLSNGSKSTTIPLGTLVNNRLTGTVLWPGAAVGTDGKGSDWPGWELNAAGEWVEAEDEFAWTRGNISASIVVNPSLSVALEYPPTSVVCANPPGEQGSGLSGLPATGMEAYVVPLGVAGGLAALAGVGLLIARRRTQN
jgi:LPXTG-motif cell wall-anchored protein